VVVEAFERPGVAELFFRLYDRPLHPEFFDICASRRITHEHYTLAVSLTPTGHVFEWGDGQNHCVEVIATDQNNLPDYGRRMTHRFGRDRYGRCKIGPTAKYQMSLQTETVEPGLIELLHHELVHQGMKGGVLIHFRPHHRIGLTPLGLVTVDRVPGGIAIAAFHTFPRENTVIKTQSLVEFSV
jgi:hypothetical protein